MQNLHPTMAMALNQGFAHAGAINALIRAADPNDNRDRGDEHPERAMPLPAARPTYSVARVGNAIPASIRLQRRWSPSDYVVIDEDGEPASDPCPTLAEAEAERDALAEVSA